LLRIISKRKVNTTDKKMAKYAFVENRSTSSKSGLKNSLSGENKFGRQAVTNSQQVATAPESF